MVNRKNLRPYTESANGVSFSPIGRWENELGSIMDIKGFDGTNFTGVYTSSVSADGKSITGPLSGTIAGDAIAFFVNWKAEYASVTGWSGLILSDGATSVIYALWNLASQPDQDEDTWRSINAGADLFFPAE